MKDLQRVLGAVPDPLGLEAVERRRPVGQRSEVQLDDGQGAAVAVVAQHGDGELAAPEEPLDDRRLTVALDDPCDLVFDLPPAPTIGALADALARALVQRLDDGGKLKRAADPVGAFHDLELRGRNSMLE